MNRETSFVLLALRQFVPRFFQQADNRLSFLLSKMVLGCGKDHSHGTLWFDDELVHIYVVLLRNILHGLGKVRAYVSRRLNIEARYCVAYEASFLHEELAGTCQHGFLSGDLFRWLFGHELYVG